MFITEQTVKNHLHNVFDNLAFRTGLAGAVRTIRQQSAPARLSCCALRARGVEAREDR